MLGLSLHLVKMVEVMFLGRYASTFCYNNPKSVIVSLNRECNLNCIMCQRMVKDFKSYDLSYSKGFDIVSTIPERCNLVFCGIGETLLYDIDNLCIFIKIAKKRNVISSIVTNGMLLTKDVSESLLCSGLDNVVVSLDYVDDSRLRSVRKGANLDVISKNIDDCNIPVSLNVVICEESFWDFSKIVDFCIKHKIKKINCKNYIEWNPIFHRVRYSKIRGMYCRLMKYYCENNGICCDIDKLLYRDFNDTCYQLFEIMHINSEGYVTGCCASEEQYIVEVFDVLEAWNSEKVRKWRRRMLNKIFTGFCYDRCVRLLK